ncbi:hypothetical protein [Marisediminicola antarctica]|nr:hypothetical protein [Marisediminicola antarctica]
MVIGGPMVIGDGVERRPDPIRRWAIRWGIVVTLILLAFAGTVVGLNASLYSADGFVRSYLSALARHDVDAALQTPGVTLAGPASRELLTADALGELTEIEHVGSTAGVGGTTVVEFSFELDGTPGSTSFAVTPASARLGFFDSWAFETSPTGILEVVPQHNSEFDANELTLEATNGAAAASAYHVLTPGVFALGHDSELLTADAERLIVLEPGSMALATVNSRANEEFVDLVQGELDALLDGCATQSVLQPTGCPFGERIANRVEGVPEWTIASYPVVTILPGDTPGTWRVPETAGTAHLVVGVQSLFDGTRSTFDDDVPFTIGYLITFPGDGRVVIDAVTGG